MPKHPDCKCYVELFFTSGRDGENCPTCLNKGVKCLGGEHPTKDELEGSSGLANAKQAQPVQDIVSVIKTSIQEQTDQVANKLNTSIQEQTDQVANKLYTQLVNKTYVAKNGSLLSSTELNTFKFSSVLISDLLLKHRHNSRFPEVSRFISLYNEEINQLKSKALAENFIIREDEHVQPITSKLCQNVLDLFGINQVEMKTAHKDVQTYYKTTIQVPMSKRLFDIQGICDEIVTGYTDKAFWYRNIPCGKVFEDKNLDENIDDPKYLAQILAQMKGFAEDFYERCNCQPLKFIGILSNGEQFYLFYRIFNEGNITWHRANLVNSSNTDEMASVFIEFVEVVTETMKNVDKILSKVMRKVDEIEPIIELFEDDEDDDDDEKDNKKIDKKYKWFKHSSEIRETSTTKGNTNKKKTKSKNKNNVSKRRALSNITENNLNKLNFRNTSPLMKLLQLS